MLKEKGRSAAGVRHLVRRLWFGGEIVGAVIGAIVPLRPIPIPTRMNAGFPWMAYIMALVGAAIGGGIGYAIAAAVPAIEEPHRPNLRAFDDDDEDEYERERARRRRRREAGADDGKFEEDRSGH